MKFKIIRLKGNSISEKYALECIEQASKFEIDVSYFDAVNGLEYQKHLTQLNINPRYKFKKGKAGVYGCFLSHYYLWKKCIEDDIPYTILEHDGFFIKPLPEDILDNFDDVLKLDSFDPYSKNYNKEIENTISKKIEYVPYVNPTPKTSIDKTGNSKHGTGNYLKGAYGYIIKPHAAEKIISWIDTNGFVPADQQIGSNIVDIKVTVPTVVRLHPNYFGNMTTMSLTVNEDLLNGNT
jgi:GR25 family glycosyltransferase involved in LPS biosynthesis